MKRLAAILTLLVACGAFAVLATGADDGDGGTYKVRAIFSNAFSVIPGEDVKIAGVKVGSIAALDVTDDHKAAVTLQIDDPGFQDFRQDASCTIRPQSLIGEKFVECTPTQPRAEGEQAPPALKKIEDGDGEGEYLLPAEQNSAPVDIDLINNIMRLPYRERFSIILNELGVGLASRGEDLRSAIRNANPALKELDKVLGILGEQNKVLADLARNGDEVLRPLARDRAQVADFIVKANTTAQASAERRTDIERNFQKFPAFLRELKPTMVRLGALTDQMTPVLEDLGASGDDISRFIEQLGPFSQAGIPAFKSLGEASVVGQEAVLKSRPIIQDVRTFAGEAKPLTKDLGDLLVSFRDTGGIERLMDYIFYQAAAINGFDSVGHYLRAVLVVNSCSTYATSTASACNANFLKPETATAAAAGRSVPTAADVQREIDNGRSPYLARQDAVLRGADPDTIMAADHAAGAKAQRRTDKGETKGSSGASKRSSKKAAPKLELPTFLPGQQPADRGEAPPVDQQQAGPQPTSEQGAQDDPTSTLLDYLLGG
ncbi:MAG: MCE family protein [Solirubrobacterales bacterium]|nr:MCE family protein [Solirubrobacterales bacterium]